MFWEEFDHKDFATWKTQFVLFLEGGIQRCKGRLGNANCVSNQKLAMIDAHDRQGHDGVKEALTQIRAKSWIIRGTVDNM